MPENIKNCWEVGDGAAWHRAENVHCTEHVRTRLALKGNTPEERHQDKLGVYVLCDGELINDRVVRYPGFTPQLSYTPQLGTHHRCIHTTDASTPQLDPPKPTPTSNLEPRRSNVSPLRVYRRLRLRIRCSATSSSATPRA